MKKRTIRLQNKIMAGFIALITITLVLGVISFVAILLSRINFQEYEFYTKESSFSSDILFNADEAVTALIDYLATADESFNEDFHTRQKLLLKDTKELAGMIRSKEIKAQATKTVEDIEKLDNLWDKLYPLRQKQEEIDNTIMTPSATEIIETSENLIDLSTKTNNTYLISNISKAAFFAMRARVNYTKYLNSVDPEDAEKLISRIEMSKKFYQNALNHSKSSTITVKTKNVISELDNYLNTFYILKQNMEEQSKIREDADAITNNILKVIEKVDNDIAIAHSEISETINKTSISWIIVVLSVVVIAMFFGIFLALILTNTITKPIKLMSSELFSSAINLESASYQISTSAQDLSTGSSELASSMEEITASLEEMQSVVENNGKNISESERMMRETASGAKNASSKMDELQKAHEEIDDNSKKIKRIIKAIDDIAFQTNILALNAAVEAARAGDAGKGFAVVADQVKNLAGKSAEAAKETSDLIETAIHSVNTGKNIGDETQEVVGNAVDLATKVLVMLEEINKSSQEQLKGIDQINLSVGQVNGVVQSTASSAEENAAAGEELLSQSESTKSIVTKLKQMVDKDGLTVNLNPSQLASNNKIKSIPEQISITNNSNNESEDVEKIKPSDKIPLEDFSQF